MIVDKITVDKMSVDKMTIDEMTVDKMSVDEMAWSHCSHTCPPTVNEIKLFFPIIHLIKLTRLIFTDCFSQV
jgi:hypothetical protein